MEDLLPVLSAIYLVFRFSELLLILPKISILVSKLEKVFVAYKTPLTDTKAIHMRIVKCLHYITSALQEGTLSSVSLNSEVLVQCFAYGKYSINVG